MSTTTTIAVDPGVGGGIAVHINGQIELHPMPETLTEISDLLRGYISSDTKIVMEEIPKFCGKKMPQSRVFVLAQNFGRLEGIVVSIGFKLTRVHPKDWQQNVGVNRAKKEPHDSWKRKLRNRARELYPHLKPTLETADALLILNWALSTNA